MIRTRSARLRQVRNKKREAGASDADATGAAQTNGNATSGLAVWNAGQDIAVPPPRQWLLGNSFCRNIVSSVLGTGGVGKTALRILQAIALATGRELTGEHVFQRTKVLIVSLEDDADELRRRVLAARLHHNIAAPELDGWLFLAAPGASAGKLATYNARSGAVAEDTLVKNIETVVLQHGIGMVLIDPFVKSHSVPENDNSAMDKVASLASELAARLEIGLDLPHHIAKGAADPGNAERGRGASATKDAGRLVYTLSPMNGDEASSSTSRSRSGAPVCGWIAPSSTSPAQPARRFGSS